MDRYENTPVSRPDHDKSAGFLVFTGGILLGSVGIAGIDHYEAETPQEALMSLTLDKPEAEVFITPSDIGFGMLAAAGLAAAAIGAKKLARK